MVMGKLVIYKYSLQTTAEVIGQLQTIKLPKKAEVVQAAMQHSTLVVWASFDLSDVETIEGRQFIVAFTGHEFEPPVGYILHHISSVIDNSSGLVFHIFEVKQAETK